jgi:TonB family protein
MRSIMPLVTARLGSPHPATPWLVSVGVHGLLAGAVLLALGRGAGSDSPRSDALARLVFVEPAPPPAPALGRPRLPATDVVLGGARPSAARVARASSEVAPSGGTLDHQSASSAAPAERPLARRAPDVEPVPPGHHRSPAGAVDAPPPTIDQGMGRDAAAPSLPGPGDAVGVVGGSGDVRGGTVDGVAGGVVGGLGRDPIPAHQAAERPTLLRRVVPVYSRRARLLGVEGQVVLEAVVDRQGNVEASVRVLRSVPLLDEAARTAVVQWRFRPARDRDGRAIPVLLEIPLRFVLEEGGH